MVSNYLKKLLSKKNPDKKFPNIWDRRFNNNLLFPSIKPKFKINSPAKIFTIGSCFARNIEEELIKYDIDLPTMKFSAPKTEWKYRSNGLLNEYNPGTMNQRISLAIDNTPYPGETVIASKDGYIDLLLPAAGLPVSSLSRVYNRRNEINDIYKELLTSDLIIITLGLTETWIDLKNNFFLNQIPTLSSFKKAPNRYLFKRLNVKESFCLLDRAVNKMISNGIKNILLTVSPVPLGTTFTKDDAVNSNLFSKSVLRVCAEELKEKYPEVDYFPSYEIVTSGGLSSFVEDNIHVKGEVVSLITKYMVNNYFGKITVKEHNID